MTASGSKALCFLLLLAMATPGVGMAATSSISDSFSAFWQSAQGQPFAEQERLWDGDIEAPRRDLYASIVWETQHRPDWQTQKQRTLQARFAEYPKLAAGIPTEVRALQVAIALQSIRLRQLFPDANTYPPVEILLAPNFDAKSGVLSSGAPVLVFAADSLLLEQANLSIVVPHELFHLYHAQHAGISNDGVMPGVDLTVPLFEEGLATYVSGQLSPGHTDGELLLQDDLGSLAIDKFPDIARRFLADAHHQAIDPVHPEIFKRWFSANAKPYQHDLPNRSGYWLGLQLVRYLRRTYSLAQIAAWSPSQVQTHAIATLQQISAPVAK